MTDKKAILPEGANSMGPYSSGIVSGGFLFVAGQVGRGPDGTIGATIEEQTRFTLENMRAVLYAAGCDFKDVVKANVYITKPEYFAVFNPIYMEYFPEPRPARATVIAALVDEKFLIEIEAIAKLP
ncbi:MAG TPA: RidA family protein [Anaerolineales bacterium]|nr:RidA family protein [Anaerolineales bacterium]HNS59504.1 RidA family protein [Anaerolineales bacterium]